MKIIDLLVKIANGEEVPKKIRFDNTNWNKVYGEKYIYYTDDCDNDLFIYFFRKNLTFNLNDEVEIIEEDKKIEKIEDLNSDYYVKTRDCMGFTKEIALDIKTTKDKINEIINVINKGD